MLVKEFYKEIWWPCCESRLREVTQESYYRSYKNHIEPAFGDMEFSELTPRLLDKWLVDEKITPGVWRVTKAFIRTAYKYEEIEKDPCSRCIHVPAREKPTPPTLSYSEMQTLMDGLEGTSVYTTICCSCYLGLRREEACALEWSDFDWGIDDEPSYVNITKGVQYIRGREITVEPKTILSKRRLPLPTNLVNRIKPYQGTGRLLGDMNVQQAADKYRALSRIYELPYVPMSNLRTSWATYMVNSGVPVSLISRYMGHADVETTVRWYVKPNEKELTKLIRVWSTDSDTNTMAFDRLNTANVSGFDTNQNGSNDYENLNEKLNDIANTLDWIRKQISL